MLPFRIVFVFIDGVGLGAATDANPLAATRWPAFERLYGGRPWTVAAPLVVDKGHVARPIDATLGVDGLPQSGTGQAALFTGENAPQLAGRHYGPYPHSKTKPAIDTRNVFQQILQLRPEEPLPVAFANAYPPRYFEYAERSDRWTVTTRACRAAGLQIHTVADVQRGKALTAELTGAAWRERLHLKVPLLTPAQAGAQLAALSKPYSFTLFEYFLTDKAGHSQSAERARTVLGDLDAFFARLLDTLDPARTLLVVTSDHGNLEDLSTKSHTRNPVPLIARGAHARAFAGVHDLTGVVPAVLTALSAVYRDADAVPSAPSR